MLAHPLATTTPRGKPIDLAAVASALGRFLLAALRWIETCAERRAQRRALRELDDHLLRDLGISRAEAWAETRKPMWRA